MRKNERLIIEELVKLGVPARVAKTRVNWASIRRLSISGAAQPELTRAALIGIAASPLLLPGLLPTPGDVVNTGADLLGRVVAPLLPESPSLPPGIPLEGELENCSVRLIGMLADGDYMKIEISGNGGSFPGDTSGHVELITDPPLPTAPGSPPGTKNEIAGSGSVILTGPRTVWLHLKGEEDFADYEITVFPRPAR